MNATDITIVLDSSSSMGRLVDETIGGFNAFIEEQKQVKSPATVTLLSFADRSRYIFNAVPLEDVPVLTRETYRPMGNTALNDAVARAIIDTGIRLEAIEPSARPNKVIVVIVTDGEENASQENTKADVCRMVEHQTSQYNWLFIYLGANVNAFDEARGLGIKVGNAANYMATPTSAAAAMRVNSANIASARRSGVSGQTLNQNDFYSVSDRAAITPDAPPEVLDPKLAKKK